MVKEWTEREHYKTFVIDHILELFKLRDFYYKVEKHPFNDLEFTIETLKTLSECFPEEYIVAKLKYRK